MLILYLLIAIGGYAVYGERVLPNVALSMSATPLTLAANVLMAIHLLSAFIIIINPVCQEVEELYNVPRGRYQVSLQKYCQERQNFKSYCDLAKNPSPLFSSTFGQ